MPTYRVHTQAGIKGPFTLRVILKGIETGEIPPETTLEEVESGRRLLANELSVGQQRKETAPAEFCQPIPQPGYAPASIPTPNQSKLPLLIGLGVVGVVALLLGTVVVARVLRSDVQPTRQNPGSNTAPAPVAETPDNSAAVSDQVEDRGGTNTEQGEETGEKRLEPLTVSEFCSWFDEDPEAAKKAAIGEMLLFEGYLYHFWTYDRYGAKRSRHVYLLPSPSPSDEQIVALENANQIILLDMDVFHDKWEMIDPSRKVLVAGRLVKPRKLDKADWQFYD